MDIVHTNLHFLHFRKYETWSWIFNIRHTNNCKESNCLICLLNNSRADNRISKLREHFTFLSQPDKLPIAFKSFCYLFYCSFYNSNDDSAVLKITNEQFSLCLLASGFLKLASYYLRVLLDRNNRTDNYSIIITIIMRLILYMTAHTAPDASDFIFFPYDEITKRDNSRFCGEVVNNGIIGFAKEILEGSYDFFDIFITLGMLKELQSSRVVLEKIVDECLTYTLTSIVESTKEYLSNLNEDNLKERDKAVYLAVSLLPLADTDKKSLIKYQKANLGSITNMSLCILSAISLLPEPVPSLIFGEPNSVITTTLNWLKSTEYDFVETMEGLALLWKNLCLSNPVTASLLLREPYDILTYIEDIYLRGPIHVHVELILLTLFIFVKHGDLYAVSKIGASTKLLDFLFYYSLIDTKPPGDIPATLFQLLFHKKALPKKWVVENENNFRYYLDSMKMVMEPKLHKITIPLKRYYNLNLKAQKKYWLPAMASKIRTEGDDLYENKKYIEAKEKYISALTFLPLVFSNEEFKSLIGSVLNNLSACCLCLNQFDEAIMYSRRVDFFVYYNSRSLIRRGIALENLGKENDLIAALTCFDFVENRSKEKLKERMKEIRSKLRALRANS